jgi:hypothetical protein
VAYTSDGKIGVFELGKLIGVLVQGAVLMGMAVPLTLAVFQFCFKKEGSPPTCAITTMAGNYQEISLTLTGSEENSRSLTTTKTCTSSLRTTSPALQPSPLFASKRALVVVLPCVTMSPVCRFFAALDPHHTTKMAFPRLFQNLRLSLGATGEEKLTQIKCPLIDAIPPVIGMISGVALMTQLSMMGP